jgi:eukaryotic-like serine/threonine-protein kinase
MRIILRVTGGPHNGKSFSFVGHDTFLVGRSQSCHFRLSEDDRYFSRIHFLVEANPPRCRLLDMNSRNGTYVNGQRVESCELHDGDKIQAGRTVIRVAVDDTDANASSAEHPIVQEHRTTVRSTVGESLPPPAVRPASMRGAPPACSACGEPAAPPIEHPACLCRQCQEKARNCPQPVKGYRAIEPLGSGAMGTVALAVRFDDGLRVALKTVTPAVAVRPNQLDRFLREANILSQLRHPNIVAFHDMGEESELLWFAMDYVRGLDAYHLLRQEGPLPVSRAVNLIRQLLSALAHAHERGFVHRDIKPSNLLVEDTAEGERAKLADFGLARVYQASQLSGLTMSGEIGGTVGFMAPEQITDFREVDPAADLYSAAATLYNLLTSAYIFDLQGDLRARLLAILQEDPIPIRTRRADVPRALAAIIHRGLERAPHKRWPDAAAFREALAPFESS